MTPAGLRQLAAAAAAAPDGKLRKIVEVVDALPERGAAEEVLSAVRPRLRSLRPARPMSVPRLLFMPLDALLADPARWKPGTGRVPRSAILAFADALGAAEPALVASVEAELRGRTTLDVAAIGLAGGRLWPAAAACVPSRAPEGWREAGLAPAAYAPLAETCAMAWRNGAAIWRLRAAAPDGPPETVARPALRLCAESGPDALALALSAVMPFARNPARLAAVAGGLSQQAAAVAARELDRFLDQAETPVGEARALSAAAASAERFAAVLADLEAGAAPERPKRAQQVHRLRKDTAEACRKRLDETAEEFLLAPPRALLAAPLAADHEVEALEAAGRAVRALAETRRKLEAQGAAARPEEVVEQALSLLRGALARRHPPPRGAFERADALRLIEILAGPEAAEQAAALARPRAG